MLDKHICYAVKSLASLQQKLLLHIVLCNMTKLHDDSIYVFFSPHSCSRSSWHRSLRSWFYSARYW